MNNYTFARIQKELLSPRFIKFCGVGVANVLVDFGSYSFFLFAGISPYLARSLSWITACIFSYFVNRSWTFNAKDSGFLPIVRFSVVNLCSLGFGIFLLYVFKQLSFGDKLSFLFSLPFTTVMNFFGYRFWAFKKVV